MVSRTIAVILIAESSQLMTGKVRAGQTKWEQAKSSQVKSDQGKSSQIKSIQIRSSQIKSDQVNSSQTKSEKVRSYEIRWKWLKIIENQCKLMNIDENHWKFLKFDSPRMPLDASLGLLGVLGELHRPPKSMCDMFSVYVCFFLFYSDLIFHLRYGLARPTDRPQRLPNKEIKNPRTLLEVFGT